jgi:tellurite methyltransferase
MAFKILDLLPPLERTPKVLEIGCGEGGTAIFLARNGYDVTAFDLSAVGVSKTKEHAAKCGVNINVFQADVNEYIPTENFDVIFSSGTIQYLLPEKRASFVNAIQEHTTNLGINVLHTFVSKPFVDIAPDAESNEHLWASGELLLMYKSWMTEHLNKPFQLFYDNFSWYYIKKWPKASLYDLYPIK